MHPGEQHIRTEATSAIDDHFNYLQIPVDGVLYDVGLTDHGIVVVTHPDGHEVARYRIKVSVEKVGTPKAAVPVTPEPPAWIEGTWGDVWDGDGVLGADGQEWEVGLIKAISASGLVDVCLARGVGEELELALPIAEAVKYRRYSCSTPPKAERTELLAAPTWHEGAWEDIRQGDTVQAPDGTPWNVTEYRLRRNGSPRVTISNGIETHTFNPEPNAMVKYSLRSGGV